MLSEEKIKLMTNLAMFEKKEGKKIFSVNTYFKSDYVSSRVLRSFFGYTLSFLFCLILWMLYYIDMWMNIINTDVLVEKGIQIIGLYIVGLVIYLIISLRVYTKRYEDASRGMKIYLAKLKRLDKRYEGGTRPGAKTKGGRN